jgi:hypothetical protein
VSVNRWFGRPAWSPWRPDLKPLEPGGFQLVTTKVWNQPIGTDLAQGGGRVALLQMPSSIRSNERQHLAPKGRTPKRFAKAPVLTGLMAMGLLWASPVLAGPQPAAPAIPQAVVECRGAHALCKASIDCQRQGTSKALCPCWNVNEPHLVQTEKIQDELVRLETQRRCTQGRHAASMRPRSVG